MKTRKMFNTFYVMPFSSRISVELAKQIYPYFDLWRIGKPYKNYFDDSIVYRFKGGILIDIRPHDAPTVNVEIGQSQEYVFQSVATEGSKSWFYFDDISGFSELVIDITSDAWFLKFNSVYSVDWLTLVFQDNRLKSIHRERSLIEAI